MKQENLLEDTKKILNSLLRAQGISFDLPVQNENEEEGNRGKDKKISQTLLKYNFGSNQCRFEQIQRLPKKDSDQYIIYGGFCLNFAFKREEDSPLRGLGKHISYVEYQKKKGIMLIHYNGQQKAEQNLDYLIHKALSLGDEQYRDIAYALAKYQKDIPTFIRLGEYYSKQLYVSQLFETYNMLYKQFENWALEEVYKIDSTSKIFAFSICKFNFETLEMEGCVSGQSIGLLALRGCDITNPISNFSRESFHYMDGESNLRLLFNQLNKVTQGKEMRPLKGRIITFDGLKIEVEHRCLHFTNRDTQYPFHHLQLVKSHLKYEFLIGIAFCDVHPETIQQVIKIRSARSQSDSMQYEDFTYSMEAQIFLEKYYNDEFCNQNNLSTEKGSTSEEEQGFNFMLSKSTQKDQFIEQEG